MDDESQGRIGGGQQSRGERVGGSEGSATGTEDESGRDFDRVVPVKVEEQ